MKKYPTYKPSGIDWLGDIPSHWFVSKVKFVSYNLDSNRIPLNQAERLEMQGEYPYYGATGIIDYINNFLIDGEFILVGEDGAPFTIPNRDVAFEVKGKVWVNNHAHIIKGKKIYHQTFLTHSLNIVDYSKYVQGSTREKLTQSDLSNIPLLDIALPEQQSIINFLDYKTEQIDSFIDNRKKQIELLKEQKAGIINKAVIKGINPDAKMKNSGIEWIGEIPEHWEVMKLKYVAKLQSGETITADDIQEIGDYPVFGGNGLRGYTTNYTNDGNFILIGRQGALCGNINYANGKFWASEHAVATYLKKPTNILWFGELLRVMNLNQYSQAAAQPGLSVDRIKNLFIPFPNYQEQKKIELYIKTETSTIYTLTSKYQKQIDLMQEYRTSLISQAVTGKIDVREWQPKNMGKHNEPKTKK